jgi:class 3 adenylate cyclase
VTTSLRTNNAEGRLVTGGSEGAKDPAVRIVEMAMHMVAIVGHKGRRRGLELGIRIGVHTGMVIGGVIGTVRFHFDMWGPGVGGCARVAAWNSCQRPRDGVALAPTRAA